MNSFFYDIIGLYKQHVVLTNKQPQVVILGSFLLTFLLIRVITHKIHAGHDRLLHDVSVGGRHIHHLVWGIALLLLTGYLALAFNLPGLRNPLALLFGVGAALTLDEFALWLDLEDVYWTREGRKSVDAVIIVATLLALILVGFSFWQEVGHEIVKLVYAF